MFICKVDVQSVHLENNCSRVKLSQGKNVTVDIPSGSKCHGRQNVGGRNVKAPDGQGRDRDIDGQGQGQKLTGTGIRRTGTGTQKRTGTQHRPKGTGIQTNRDRGTNEQGQGHKRTGIGTQTGENMDRNTNMDMDNFNGK
jgi:hypothetical protein